MEGDGMSKQRAAVRKLMAAWKARKKAERQESQAIYNVMAAQHEDKAVQLRKMGARNGRGR